MYDPYAQFTKHVLSNGLEVHYVHIDRPWIKVEVVVHSGAREDALALPGLAHFVEHVVSKNIPGSTYQAALDFFESCGGSVGFGSTNYRVTRYGFWVPTQRIIFPESLHLMGSMLLLADLEKGIERERDIITREFNDRYPFHAKLTRQMAFRKALFSGHRLETWNRPLGRLEGISAISKTQLKEFYTAHYVPANMSLVVVGGLSAEEVVAELERSPFGTKKAGVRNPIPKPLEHLPSVAQRYETVVHDRDVSDAGRATYDAFWSFPAGLHRQAVRIFGQMLNDLLMTEIRENRGLVYDIDTEGCDFHDVCEFGISGSTTPDAVPEVERLIEECILKVSSQRALFEKKLRGTLQDCLMSDLSGRKLASGAAMDLEFHQRIVTIREVWDGLHQVTFEQMAEAASYLSPDRRYVIASCR